MSGEGEARSELGPLAQRGVDWKAHENGAKSVSDRDLETQLQSLLAPLHRYCAARIGPLDAPDATQETLLRLLRLTRTASGSAAHGFDPQRGTLRMLAFGIARNVLNEMWRNEARGASPKAGEVTHPSTERSPSSAHEARSLEPAEAALLLSQLMKVLSPIEQDVISLLVSKDLSLDEIGKILDLNVNTIKSHMHRAREKMARHAASSWFEKEQKK